MSVSSSTRATGLGAVMHIVGIVCAALVPLAMLLDYVNAPNPAAPATPPQNVTAWEFFDRVDIVALVFCVLAIGCLVISLLAQRRSLGTAAAALMFAVFGFMLALPLEANELVDPRIGGRLIPLLALIAAGAATYAAELVPVGPGAPPVGAGRGADPSFTAPITAAAPTGQPQTPSGGGGTAPGWYDDPQGQARLRYYDGRNWTEQTSN